MQSLRTIQQFEIKWLEPAKSLMAVMSFAQLRFEMLGLPCYIPQTNPIATYVLQLLALPSLALASLLPGVLARLLRRKFKFRIMFKLFGMVFVSFFTGITLMCFKPLECRENPNGKSTALEYAQVLCWESNDHIMLVVLSIIGILAYPVSVLAWLVHLTWNYPIWLLSARGISTVEKYHFLFGKFRPERYYYCVLLTLGNLLVGCIPACFSSLPALQVGVMSFVLWTRNALHCLLWPWRVEAANWSELLLQGGVALLLSLAAPLLNLEASIQDRSEFVLTVCMSVLLLLLPFSVCLAATLTLFLRARKQNRYTTFLSHHKASSGILCRYLKIVMTKNARVKVFYDSDDLLNLGDLFETLRTRTDSLLAVLTPGFLHSVWCIGELTLAFHCSLPIFALCCDGFKLPECDLNQIESGWPENEIQMLVAHGVGREEVQAALAYLHRLEHFQISRTAPGKQQEAVALSITSAILDKSEVKSRIAFSTPERTAGEVVGKARVLVASSMQADSMSTSLVIQHLMQHKLQQRVCHVHQAAEIEAAFRASSVVVVMGKHSLEDADFSDMLMAMPGAWMRLLVNDGSFDFPTHDFYRRIRDGQLQFRGNPHDIIATYQGLCSSLASRSGPWGYFILPHNWTLRVSYNYSGRFFSEGFGHPRLSL